MDETITNRTVEPMDINAIGSRSSSKHPDEGPHCYLLDDRETALEWCTGKKKDYKTKYGAEFRRRRKEGQR